MWKLTTKAIEVEVILKAIEVEVILNAIEEEVNHWAIG